ncbi:MAG: THUMP domain-containing protein [Bacteroidota bacterium]
MKLLVKTLAGLEGVLADELQQLGAQNIEPLKRAVSCEGDLALLYRANLWLRCGIRILVPVFDFQVESEEELYQQLRTIDWSKYLQLHQTFAIDANSQSSRFRHNRFLAQKTKDAIVDWFREQHGRRPSVNPKSPDIRFHLHIDSRHQASFLLDSSGDGLHRRGYRTTGGAAPLNEVLAAGMIRLAGWKGDQPFVDMLCGSGTLLIEAAMITGNIPPGLLRSFAFQNWQNFDADLWQGIKSEARQSKRPPQQPIIGVDNHFKAIRIAENNIAAAKLQSYIRVKRSTFQQFLPPEGPGTLISNPPYDLRLETRDINGLYKEIGDRLKKEFTGYQAWLLSGNLEALKNVGLRPSRRIHLLNGQIACKFHKYELYSGSKKKGKEGVDEKARNRPRLGRGSHPA